MGEIARFLFHRSHYASSKKAVKPGAFLPRNGQTSVFDIVGLNEAGIRRIGSEVGAIRGRDPRGRGELRHVDVTEVGLRFERDDRPLRHGNLVGWPSSGRNRKDRNKDLARGLAQKAVLVLHD